MKIVIINGSARKGNTLAAINAFIKGASEKNKIEIIEPDKLNIAPCKGCGVCQCSKGCVDKDDTNSTIDKIAAADNLLDVATEQIGSLANLPQKFRLVDDPVLASWGIRFVIINNYLAFYTINEEKQTVIIVRFLYQKSSWTSILRQGFCLI